MEEKNISPEESLQIIEKMLADARNRFYNNGITFLFWGVLIILACIVQYIMIKMGYAEQSNYVWLYAILLGIVLTVFEVRYKVKRRGTSRLDAYNGMIWLGFAITYVVVMFMCVKSQVYPVGYIWSLLGFAMFVSARIYKFKPLLFGAIIFWLGAIGTVYLGNNINELWVSAVIMLVAYIVPGYLLWKKAKKEANV